jgi:hypothetical protein
LALQLGRTRSELVQTLSYEDKIELAAWCRINGPLPILRPDYYSAQIAALIFNSNLSAKSAHDARSLDDCLLWGEKPDTLEADIVKAMASAGVAKKKGGNV